MVSGLCHKQNYYEHSRTNFHVKISSERCPRVLLLDCMVNTILLLKGSVKLFSGVTVPFFIPIARYEWFYFSASAQVGFFLNPHHFLFSPLSQVCVGISLRIECAFF